MRRNGSKGSSCTCFEILLWSALSIWAVLLIFFFRHNGLLTSLQPETIHPNDMQNDLIQLRGGLSSVSAETRRNNSREIHVIFSTDCGSFQDWQSLLLFHSAKAVGQEGHITRIASGCDNEKQLALTELYGKLYPNYYVHFTPDFKHDPKSNKKYDFYNKPYGVQHWLEHASPPIEDGVVVALIDPDMIFVRPLTPKVLGVVDILSSNPVKRTDYIDYISRGHPVAQQYGLGAPWVNDNHKKFNRRYICGEHSPCLDVPSEAEGAQHYSVGPPYIMEKTDLHRVVNSWTKFVPRVYEGYPYLLAEMYAYSMAAAHEQLPHLRLDHYMVSNVDAGGEGWQWVDSLEDACIAPENGIYYGDKPMPTLVHYCQGYSFGDFVFQKRRVAHDIFSCEKPLLKDPPIDFGKVTEKLDPNMVGIFFNYHA
jgi:hypothetical protein